MGRIRAAVMPGPGRPIEVRELPEPELETGAALLAVLRSEVCGTDVHLRDGRLEGVPYPIIPGHVTVGHLDKIRGTIRDVHGRPLAEGDVVTFLDVHRTCNACWHCLVSKATTRCPDRRVYGITYGLDDGPSGGWATHVLLKPETRCLRLEDADPILFMAAGCGLPTALHAAERGEVGPGDQVLVLGSGPVGLAAIAVSVLRGADRVWNIGGPEGRLAAGSAMGASGTLDFASAGEAERESWVRDLTGGRGADVTIEATGDPAAVRQAMRCTRDAGRVVIAGQYTDRGDVTLNPHTDLNRKHLDVRGCWGSDFSHFHAAVRIMSDPERARPWSRLKLATYGLGGLDEALEAVERGRVVKALVDPAEEDAAG